MRKIVDLVGQKFNRLLVIEFAYSDKVHRSFWKCLCNCGNTKIIIGTNLKNNQAKSCGCLQKEHAIKQGKKNKTHNLVKTSEYYSWANMKDRCYNKNNKRYKDWGQRGIKVCERWQNSFENFLSDMGNKPGKEYSLDRIDNNGNYEPENCKWSTKLEQNTNKRNNIKIINTITGKTYNNLKEAAKDNNINHVTLKRHLTKQVKNKAHYLEIKK